MNISIMLTKKVKTDEGDTVECSISTAVFIEEKITDIDFNALHARLDCYADCALQKYYEGETSCRQPNFIVPMKGGL